MGFLVNGLKICESQGVKPSRVGPAAGATWAICLAISVAGMMWCIYNYGINHDIVWSYSRCPSMAFDAGEPDGGALRQGQELDASLALSTWQRFAEIRPDPKFLWSAGTGFGLVMLFSFLRLRYTWWPLHPVLFLLWATNSAAEVSHSFLLGWMIKMAVTKLGGSKAYEQGKKFMVGAIAGEILCSLLFTGIGSTYYFATGVRPALYKVTE